MGEPQQTRPGEASPPAGAGTEPATGARDEGAAADTLEDMWWRLLFLGALVILVQLWCYRHLGAPLKSLFALVLLLPVISMLGSLVELLRGEKEWKAVLRNGARLLVKWPVLLGLGAVALLISLFVSSVRIDARGHGAALEAVLVGDDVMEVEHTLQAPPDEPLLVRWVPTTPLGATYRLQAAGYREHSFELRPWWGHTITRSSLNVQPSVIVRVPIALFPQLGQGRVELWRRDTWEMIGQADLGAGNGAVVFGIARQPSELTLEEWKADLRMIIGPTEEGERLIDNVFSRWTSPIQAETAQAIDAGTELVAVFRLGAKAEACATFTVDATEIIDVLLTVSGVESEPCEEFNERSPGSS